MMIDVRSEYESGKLLFRWDPDENVVAIVLKDTLYKIQLNKDTKKGVYKIIEKRSKKEVNRLE